VARQKEGVYEGILACATREFLDKGYDGASLRAIATGAGTTTSSIYTRFGDKAGLFDALVAPHAAHIADSLQQALASAENGALARHIPPAWVEDTIDYIYDHYDHIKLLVSSAEGSRYASFLHRLVSIEVCAALRRIRYWEERGRQLLPVDAQLLHMVASGFFSGIFEIVVHDMDRSSAKKQVSRLRDFYIGGMTRLLGAEL